MNKLYEIKDEYVQRRLHGEMICKICGGYSSSSVHWTCGMQRYKETASENQSYTLNSNPWNIQTNPFSNPNIMNNEMREMVEKQKNLKDKRSPAVKQLLKEMGYNIQ